MVHAPRRAALHRATTRRRTDIWTRSLPLLADRLRGGRAATRSTCATGRWQRNLARAPSWSWPCWSPAGRSPTCSATGRCSPARRASGRPSWPPFLIGPAIPSLVFGQWGDAVQTVVEGLAVLAVIYLVTSYGVFAAARLGGARERRPAALAGQPGRPRAAAAAAVHRRSCSSTPRCGRSPARSTGLPYVVTLGDLLPPRCAVRAVADARRSCAASPRSTTGPRSRTWSPAPRPSACSPTGRPAPSGDAAHRPAAVNVGLVSVFSQALQITFVALAADRCSSSCSASSPSPRRHTQAWTGARARARAARQLDLGGRTLVITEPLLRVAGFLGAFTGHVLHRRAVHRRHLSRRVRRGRRAADPPGARRAGRLPVAPALGGPPDQHAAAPRR